MVSKVLDTVAAIEEPTCFTIDEADLTFAHVNIIQALMDDYWLFYRRQIVLEAFVSYTLIRITSFENRREQSRERRLFSC